MPTEKEKIVLELIYNEYKDGKNADKIYIDTNELIDKSAGRLTLPDLHALILHGNSQYIGFHGATGSMVKILPAGIAYMENESLRVVGVVAFWIFGLATVVAVAFTVLTYYK